MATNPKRVSAGVPTGGEFAPNVHEEPDLRLPAGVMTDEQAQLLADECNRSQASGHYLIVDPATWASGDYLANRDNVDYFRSNGFYCLQIRGEDMEPWDVVEWAERERAAIASHGPMSPADSMDETDR